MNDLRNESNESQSLPGRRRPWWRAALRGAVIGLGILIAMTLATGVLLWWFRGDAEAAANALRAARPWVIAVQCISIGLLWQHWEAFIAWISRLRKFPPARQAALLRDKHRIFRMLAWCELLVVVHSLIT
jgi:glutathione S-transferase